MCLHFDARLAAHYITTPRIAIVKTELDTDLKTIQQTAVDAAKAQKLDIRQNAHSTSYLIGGTVQTLVEDKPPRQHTALDIESLAGWCEENTVVWHNNDEVTAILDDDEYRESSVTMPLPLHPKYAAFQNIRGEFTQKGLIDFLRLNLKDEIETAFPGFIATIRKLQFLMNDSGSSNIQVGRESMGRSIDEQVTGAGDIPEEIKLTLPLWLHLDKPVTIIIAIDINIPEKKFRFQPKPGELAAAIVDGQKWLHGQLEAACNKAAIYFGSPGEIEHDAD